MNTKTQQHYLLQINENELMMLQMAMEALVEELKELELFKNAENKSEKLLEALYSIKK